MEKLAEAGVKFRMFGIAVFVAVLFGALPTGTFAAQTRGGSSYSSPTYGFSVAWDDSIWSVEETADTDGVEFNADLSYGFVQAISDYSDGAEGCLADSQANIESKENIAEFKVAPRRMERPVTGVDTGELFTYVNTDNDAEIALYIECRDLTNDDAVLQIMFLGFKEDYTDALPLWEGVLGTVDTDGGRNGGKTDGADSGKIGKAETAAVGVVGNEYTNPEYGFSATWDEDAWTPEFLPGAEDYSTGFALGGEYSYGMVLVESLNGDFEDCAVDYAEQIGSWEAFSKFRKATKSFTLPELAEGAVGALYTYVDNTDPDNPVKVVAYFECRLLPDEVNTLITLLAVDPKIYGDELPLWEELLTGIEIKGAGSDSTSDDGQTDDSDIQVDGTTFVGQYFNFELTYDDHVWEAEDLSDGGNDFLDLSSEMSIGTVIAFDAPYDGAGCVETIASLKQGEGVSGFNVAPDSFERPRTVRNADSELFLYTFESENGPIEILTYVECRELENGEASLGVSLSTVPDVYQDALPEFEQLLAGIEIA